MTNGEDLEKNRAKCRIWQPCSQMEKSQKKIGIKRDENDTHHWRRSKKIGIKRIPQPCQQMEKSLKR